MNIALMLAQAASRESYKLSPGGWVIMILSVGFVTGLLAWCIWRVLRESSPQKLHGQLDVDTHDLIDS